MRAAGHVGERRLGFRERKGLVHHRCQTVRRDRVRHRLKVTTEPTVTPCSRCCCITISGRRDSDRPSSEHADEGDGAADSGRTDRFIECADAADFDDEVDAVIACRASAIRWSCS